MTLLERVIRLRETAEAMAPYDEALAIRLLKRCIEIEQRSRPQRDAQWLCGNPPKRRRAQYPRQHAAAWRRKENARYLLIRRSKELQRLFDRLNDCVFDQPEESA